MLVQCSVCCVGLRVVILVTVWSGSGFLRFVGNLAYRPGEVARVYWLLDSIAEGCPGHCPVHLLVDSAAETGFQWNSRQLGWERPGLPVLSNLAGLIQHFWSAVLEAWRK